jgi:hypothetical protein
MKTFSDVQMKAWNQEAAAGDLAPEARQTIAHGETVGECGMDSSPGRGERRISIIAWICRPCRGFGRFDERTHSCRRGLFSSAPPALKIPLQKSGSEGAIERNQTASDDLDW